MRRPQLQLAILMVVAVSFLGACGASKPDSAITSDIQAKLFNDPVLKTRDIRVNSQSGVVTLSGTVSTDLEKAAAEHFAAGEEGVKSVVNTLIVASQPASQPAEASPAPETAPETAQAAPPAPVEKSPKARHRKPTRVEEASMQPNNYMDAASAMTPAAQVSSNPPAAAAPAPAPAPQPAPAPAPAPKPVDQVTVPSGTVVTIRMIDGIDSRSNRPGEEFSASLDAPIVVGDRVVAQRGADARVRLVNAKTAGSMTGQSQLQLELISVTVNGKAYSTQSGYYEQHGASRGKRTAATVGGGAVLGALVGGLLGHGKGAAIGSAVGAGTGTAVQVATKGEQVKIPAETKLDFTLKAPVDVIMSGGA